MEKNCILTFDLFVPSKHSTGGIGKKRNVFFFFFCVSSQKIPWWSPRPRARHTPSSPDWSSIETSEHKRRMMRRIESLVAGTIYRPSRHEYQIIVNDEAYDAILDRTLMEHLSTRAIFFSREKWWISRLARWAQISRSFLIFVCGR